MPGLLRRPGSGLSLTEHEQPALVQSLKSGFYCREQQGTVRVPREKLKTKA